MSRQCGTMRRFGWSGAAVAAVILGATSAGGSGRPTGVAPGAGDDAPPALFAPAGPAPAAGEGTHSAVVRRRAVHLDHRLLATARPGQPVRFNLFDDVSITAVLERIRQRGESAFTWTGPLQGGEPGRFTLAVDGEAVAAQVRGPGARSYRVRAVGARRHVVEEIDATRLPPCGNGPEHGVDAGPAAGGGPYCDDGSVIQVLVAYTPLARADAGGTAAMRAVIDLMEAETNEAYAASAIGTSIDVVHRVEVDYPENGTYTEHLSRLTSPGDGYMDEVHALRDEHGADMVALLVVDNEYCGQAWLMQDLSRNFATRAFSVTTWYCGGDTFAHELGHNMGCCHAPGDGGGCNGGGLFDYSSGHRFFGDGGQQWRTVMAYAPGRRLLAFSNPEVTFDGVPTGVPEAADNALTINQTALTIANFRTAIEQCRADLDGSGDVGFGDILAVLNAWGPYGNCPPYITEDLDESCEVGFNDLLDVLGQWGPCTLADDCVDARPGGDGSYRFSTLCASDDGPNLPPACDEGNGRTFRRDVWVRYVASCTGVATASVCESDYNTKLAVYAADACPGALIVCGDDGCGDDGTRSRVEFDVVEGEAYLVRIGGRTDSGTGTLVLSCE